MTHYLRGNHLLGLLLIGAATGSADGQTETLRLVDQGKSSCVIACQRDADPATLLAATELQAFVRQSTGVKLPIVAPPQAEPVAIVLQTDSSLPWDGFTLRVAGGNLIITGHDTVGDPRHIDFEHPVSCGTLYGIYEVLERFLGVRFYWPDELGTIVPHHQQFEVPADLRVQQSPHFVAMRRFWQGPGCVDGETEAASQIWGRRLRLGASMPTDFRHAWWRILDVEKWVAEGGSKDVCALLDGARSCQYRPHHAHHGGQVCVSDPQVQDTFVKAAKESTAGMVSLSPNDGDGGHCECEACRALDDGRDVSVGRRIGQRDLSDRIIGFYNLIAERSGRKIGGFAYNEYIEPPAHTRLHPNVTIFVAPNNAFVSANPTQLAWAETLCRLWGEYAPRTIVQDVLYYPPQRQRLTTRHMDDLIAPLGVDIEKRVRLIARSGLAGVKLYIAPMIEQSGADTYVAAKLLWDPSVDAEAIRQAYYRDLYGPAWRHVQDLFQTAEAAWRTAATTSQGARRRTEALKIAPKLDEILREAEAAAGNDPEVTKRLARLRVAVQQMLKAGP